MTNAHQSHDRNPDTAVPNSPASTEATEAPADQGKLKKLLKRFGVAGFLFFFIKGLLWLLIPLLIALGWFGGK